MVLTRGGKRSNCSNRASTLSKSTASALPRRRSDRIAAGLGPRPSKRRFKTFVHLSDSSASSGPGSDDDAPTPSSPAPPPAAPEPPSAPPPVADPGSSSSPTSILGDWLEIGLLHRKVDELIRMTCLIHRGIQISVPL